MAGALLGYVELAAQIAAMALSPPWPVQAVMAAGLVVALAGWARRGQAGDPRRLALAVGLLVVGLGAVVAAGAGRSPATAMPLGRLVLFAAVVGGASATVRRGRTREAPAASNAVAAGLLYGVTTVALEAALALRRSDPLLGAAILAVGVACGAAAVPACAARDLSDGRGAPDERVCDRRRRRARRRPSAGAGVVRSGL